MAKAKSKATVMVADGAGGMVKVEDHRFEAEWPIQFEVPKGDQADTWLRYLNDECHRRDWSSSSFGQLEPRENSGSITVNDGRGQSLIAISCERKRGGPIKVRARPCRLEIAEADNFLTEVNDRCQSQVKERVYYRRYLEYEGRGWSGEVWLEDTLRLGPPSRQQPTALRNGARIIVVDAMVECVGPSDAPWSFARDLGELAAFLSVVIGTLVHLERQGTAWTWPAEDAVANCAVRQLGYLQAENPLEMPARGAAPPLQLWPVDRPDLSLDLDRAMADEQPVPADIVELWTLYRSLPSDRRRQFLQAAAKWQEALMHWGERSTLSYALMVVACEALKPAGREFWDHNINHIIEALIGKAWAERLARDAFPPKRIRGSHLHRGEFHSSEFLQAAIMSSYEDPSFDDAARELGRTTPAAIIEWLRRGGTFNMPTLTRKKSLRRWVKDHSTTLLPVFAFAGLVLGWLLGIRWG